MPIDLTPAGKASPYPAHSLRILPWCGIWGACNAIGAAIALLLWPKGVPASGSWFWFCALGIPNLGFAVLLGIARALYEALWLHAMYRNKARRKWIAKEVRRAQRPLQVLGVGHCLPLDGLDLVNVISAAKPVLAARPARIGAGLILHNRFEEETFTAVSIPEEFMSVEDTTATASQVAVEVATIVLKIEMALTPFSESLHALSQYGPAYAPAVRVLARPEEADLRTLQVRDALQRAKLPAFECAAVPADQGLMVVDAWLDAHDPRPLLVIAAEWHEANPPVGSSEGCVAVLLNSGFYQLPEPVRVAGILHRPVAGETSALGDLLTMALRWGGAEHTAVSRAWITGLDSSHDSALLTAWEVASLTQLAKTEAQSRPDRVIGDAGPLNPWLSVAAAIVSGVGGPQLIIDRAQAAVLYVTSSSHDQSDQ